MRRFRSLSILSLSLMLIPVAAYAQTGGSIKAASCQLADVEAVINGPTHKAVNSDTINIPAGSCTWTTGLTVPSGIGITIIGAGSANTNITDNITTSNPLIQASPQYGNTLMRISSMTLTQSGSSVVFSPILLAGTCTLSGCPNVRVDNIVFANWLGNGQATWMIRAANVFGVIDHNTVGSDASPHPIQALANITHASYLGTGLYGDNSWSQPDNLGTANALYLENNTLHGGASATDCDISNGATGNIGGCRQVGRFNTVTSAGGWVFSPHGTESDGRPRGGRLEEVYNNNVTCTDASSGCGSVAGYRSGGTGLVFNNTFTTTGGAWWNAFVTLTAFRTWASFTPYGGCNGEGPWDKNDGATQTSASTFTSTASTTLTDTSQSWTTNQFAPGTPGTGKYYTVYNASKGQFASIVSNTTTALTIKNAVSWSAGDTYYINGTTLYAKGTVTSVSGGSSGNFTVTVTDTSQSWTTNQWIPNGAPYTLVDISAVDSAGFVGDVGWEVTSNTSNTVTSDFYGGGPPYNHLTVNVGDTFVILRATVCLDQPGRSGGTLLSGANPTPVGYINETLDPVYEWGDTISGNGPNQGVVATGTARLIANRDWYNENKNQSAQTSSSSPFSGDPTTGPGIGHGTLANRPATCTTGVAYWATDQGNWNQSGSGGQGELFKCLATNTWTMAYEPYTYPHPLITGGTSGTGGIPNPPTSLAATVQ